MEDIKMLARRNSEWLPSFLDEIFDDSFLTNNATKNAPALNIVENKKEYQLEFAVPGLKKDDLKIQLDDDVLTIAMEQKSEKENNNEEQHYIRKEFNYAGFTQSLIVPENADKTAIAASVENGVLKVSIPKLAVVEEKSASRVIEIQ